MKIWLTTVFVISTLASGVLGGMPLHSSSREMMKCCVKAKSKERSPAAEAARLCCAMNCSKSAPTASAGSFNSSPSNVTIYKSIADQIAALFPNAKVQNSISPQYSRDILTRTFQPKYIQHNSFLI